MLLKTAGAVLALAGAGLASAQSRVVYDSRVTTPEPRITESERGRVKYLAKDVAPHVTTLQESTAKSPLPVQRPFFDTRSARLI
ncbi:hypothetical protein [Deinococcus arcticus]|uniref:hypothetical protein n=1 Tax=Deinococcus arcticus TaxID=2136176 RepID=UPI0011B1E496|nr:hypothetical protein [Deinococcus arcticus]